eukprot:TRINITY_DN2000_c0_g1_i2.p1 TRINITY_DN2000_c0_g1~~TRINITY_DN2000_c0_g1_i2.p1  ORF type:complete len:347 (+),score=95.14 TRINITY_DN2000_c0_g1_i2:542-1582(+)
MKDCGQIDMSASVLDTFVFVNNKKCFLNPKHSINIRTTFGKNMVLLDPQYHLIPLDRTGEAVVKLDPNSSSTYFVVPEDAFFAMEAPSGLIKVEATVKQLQHQLQDLLMERTKVEASQNKMRSQLEELKIAIAKEKGPSDEKSELGDVTTISKSNKKESFIAKLDTLIVQDDDETNSPASPNRRKLSRDLSDRSITEETLEDDDPPSIQPQPSSSSQSETKPEVKADIKTESTSPNTASTPSPSTEKPIETKASDSPSKTSHDVPQSATSPKANASIATPGSIKEGYLEKKGGSRRRNWNKRWFVLLENTIIYYKKQDKKNRKRKNLTHQCQGHRDRQVRVWKCSS